MRILNVSVSVDQVELKSLSPEFPIENLKEALDKYLDIHGQPFPKRIEITI
jgi:hypothetical protein